MDLTKIRKEYSAGAAEDSDLDLDNCSCCNEIMLEGMLYPFDIRICSDCGDEGAIMVLNNKYGLLKLKDSTLRNLDTEERKARLRQEHDDFCATNTVFAAARERHITIIAEHEVEIEKLKGFLRSEDVDEGCLNDDGCTCPDCIIAGHVETINQQTKRHEELQVKCNQYHEMLERMQAIFDYNTDWDESDS